jgi:hypothetical protein
MKLPLVNKYSHVVSLAEEGGCFSESERKQPRFGFAATYELK